MLQRKKAADGRVGMGDQSRMCLALSLAMQVAATLAFLAYVAWFPKGDAGGLYQWWRSQDHSGGGSINVPPADEAASAGSVRAPTTLSHIMFGIGSSARTWYKRRGYAELWWRSEQMRGHVWLEQEPPVGKWPAATTSPPYRVSADTCSRFGRLAPASRMARIVADSFLAATAEMGNNNGTAAARDDLQVRWFVMGDDDTVFFPDNLVAVLRKYDHEEMYYVGAPSESVEQDAVHLYGTAFGGGGFAVSYPAAAELAKAIDGCLDRYTALFGSDERVHACLSELGVPLTREPGFHQMDIRGDAYGMLAAHPVAPLVSLHHLDRVRPINPQGETPLDAVRPLVDASKFDPARVLQQSMCYQQGPGYNWSVSISWGYTTQVYPWTVPARELEIPLQTFRTWQRKSNGPFVFNTRPWVTDNACARPAIFFLSHVRNDTRTGAGGAATVTEYSTHHHDEQADKECDEPSFRAASVIRTVRVFSPLMSSGDWQRAPRRHCCEVGRIVQGSVLEVQVRRCGREELATPQNP